jgi:glyoxylase I family protein
MADQSPFSTGIIHHYALRVGDVEASKKWLTTMLGFQVRREFQIGDRDFAFLSPDGAEAPVIELVGGPVDERQLPEDIPDMMKLAGWHHLCLQVRNVEQCVSELRRRGVKISSRRWMARPKSACRRWLSSPIRGATSTSYFNPLRKTRRGSADKLNS